MNNNGLKIDPWGHHFCCFQTGSEFSFLILWLHINL